MTMHVDLLATIIQVAESCNVYSIGFPIDRGAAAWYKRLAHRPGFTWGRS